MDILSYLLDNFANGNFSDVVSKLDEMNRFDAMSAVIRMYEKFDNDDRRILKRILSRRGKLILSED